MGWGELVTEIVVGDARVVFGDCRDVLKTLADCSVDSVVTDPPYELGFMGKKWDGTGIAYDVSRVGGVPSGVETWRACPGVWWVEDFSPSCGCY